MCCNTVDPAFNTILKVAFISHAAIVLIQINKSTSGSSHFVLPDQVIMTTSSRIRMTLFDKTAIHIKTPLDLPHILDL